MNYPSKWTLYKHIIAGISIRETEIVSKIWLCDYLSCYCSCRFSHH